MEEPSQQSATQTQTLAQSQPSTQSSEQTPPSNNEADARMYPRLVINNNEHPNRLYAFPFIGITIKAIMLIPVGIVLIAFGFVVAVLWLLVPFVILFTGKYWHLAYEIMCDYFIYSTKARLFLIGLTDKYPGFTMKTNGIFEFHLEKPVAPSRILAFPLAGILFRVILLIPYMLYEAVLYYGSIFATIASWFAVTVKGKYPESLYEFNRDAIRISLAYQIYLYYLSDTYPSFWISMKHKTTKILLIVLGALLFIVSQFSGGQEEKGNDDLLFEQSTQNSSDPSLDY